MKILLDMGHTLSGSDTGAEGCGRREQDCTREIGYKVKAKLEALGHTVVVCSKDSCSSLMDSLSYRANTANNAGGDLYLALHLNAFNGDAYGTEVYTYGSKEFEEAKNVLNNIVALGYHNRGIKDGSRLYIIRNTSMKSMLVECCFIDNENDMYKYNAENIASAIVKGITGTAVETDSPSEQAKNKPYEYGIVTAKNGLKIRKGPGTGYDELGILQCGEKVHIDFEDNGWYSVFWGDHGGFISSEFVEEYKEIDNWITRLQCECNEQGFSSQTVDGIPGSNTLAGCPLLRYGSVGDITKLIQEKLGVTADGIFGNDTRAAVVAFQRKHNLSADGIVGRNTWGALLGL